MIFSIKPELSGGSKRTADFGEKHEKPLLYVHAETADCAASLRDFVAENAIKVLNVAGPRPGTWIDSPSAA